ncbi:MAG: M15 family metallopeptidase [Clostridia bacterium]|nr:M15 family metallopeptidase [Clostridia bacterium]
MLNVSKKTIAFTLILLMSTVCGCKADKSVVDTEATAFTNAAAVSSDSLCSETVSSTTQLPTSTPTPIPTPTVTPSPTPVPEFIEPEYDTVWYNGFVDPKSVRAEVIQNPDDILAVVNKYNAIPDGWVPDDLVTAPHSYDQQLRAEANDAWVMMYDDCVEAIGEGPLLVSGWRTPGTQEYLFNRSANKNGYAFACQKNALPNRSEHQLGLAIDITTSYWTNISDDFAETDCGKWINEHCFEYGYILRYQSQYTDSTGYGIEAWHYRYVGVEVATYLFDNDISLEEYLGKAQILPEDE